MDASTAKLFADIDDAAKSAVIGQRPGSVLTTIKNSLLLFPEEWRYKSKDSGIWHKEILQNDKRILLIDYYDFFQVNLHRYKYKDGSGRTCIYKFGWWDSRKLWRILNRWKELDIHRSVLG